MSGQALEMACVSALQAARQLWPDVVNGVFVGTDGEQVMVGFIRSDKRAIRFTAPTLLEALNRAMRWTRENPGRIESWDGSRLVMRPVAAAPPAGGGKEG